ESVPGFAFPNGRRDDYNETAIQLVREAGFTCAVTTQRGLNDIHTPVLELRRGGPWEVDLPTYAVKLAYYSVTGACEKRSIVMCGIFGYIGGREATSILLDGLRRIEYSGYD